MLLMVQKSGDHHLEHNIKPVVDNGINYQPQLVIARFLDQQYDSYPSSDLPAHVASPEDLRPPTTYKWSYNPYK